MEKSQAYNGLSIYISAPSSPSKLTSQQNMVHFYSTRTSPRGMNAVLEEAESTNFDEFEFETSKRFRQEGFKERPASEAFVPMAFADELFRNGQVVPLKPPPCLSSYSSLHRPKYDSAYWVRRSSSTSASPNPVSKIPFPRWKNTWSDEFDPFAVALEKVTEEKMAGKRQNHRRSRSLSPFKTTGGTTPPLQDQKLVKHRMGPNWPQEDEPKRSALVVVSPRGLANKYVGYLAFGRKVRPVKVGHEGTMKAVEEGERETEESCGGEKREKGKGFLGRENNEVKVMKEQVAALWKKLRSLSESPRKKERKSQDEGRCSERYRQGGSLRA